jgi:hypothetical protein
MITIKDFKDYKGNKKDIIVFKCIEIYIVSMSSKYYVFLIGYSINGVKYYIYVHYLNFWRFRKQISKKLLYKLFDKKTVNDLYLEKTVAFISNNNTLLDYNYVILRKQVIL